MSNLDSTGRCLSCGTMGTTGGCPNPNCGSRISLVPATIRFNDGQFHPVGRCACAGEGRCSWCKVSEIGEKLASFGAAVHMGADYKAFYEEIKTIMER